MTLRVVMEQASRSVWGRLPRVNELVRDREPWHLQVKELFRQFLSVIHQFVQLPHPCSLFSMSGFM